MSTDQRRGSAATTDHTRITVRYDDPLVDRVEALVDEDVFPNRSEALRQLVARGLDAVEGANAGD
ncbi:ribbon-helix-helix domain-containing protein [Halostella litorea]|uniref:ribbon-helix-helix domain-containing protein n=1 Tax=Halostella litorea TaxID=2528831 RepID=UPI001386D736|nr:ribbon-helix-helix domain-containing protein [Halostella litorea]